MHPAEVIDVCCGSRMFWFDRQDERAIFMDNREIKTNLCDGRAFEVSPDIVADFRQIPFENETFSLVVFDPPHLVKAGNKSWLATKYGKLADSWQDDIKQGFKECFRILKPNGVLIFKWCEEQIKLKEILALTEKKPLFGNRRAKTHWIVFIKSEEL